MLAIIPDGFTKQLEPISLIKQTANLKKKERKYSSSNQNLSLLASSLMPILLSVNQAVRCEMHNNNLR